MNAGICHILAPEEFTQWFACSPKHYLVVVDAIELQRLQNALVRVAAVYVTLADDFAELISRVDRALFISTSMLCQSPSWISSAR